jgi:hypothetical protein
MSLDLREAVARIIDPWAMGFVGYNAKAMADRKTALVLADAILALPQLSDLTVRCGELEEPAEAVLIAMCEAEYTATHDPLATPAGGFTRWATWGEACRADGFLAEKIKGMRAALRASQALAAKAGGDKSSRDLSTTTNAAPSASGLADPTPPRGEGGAPDHKPDGSGLDDGPWLPGKGPRSKPAPKSKDQAAAIRAKAWATRRGLSGEGSGS